jgi:hypothetical protein
LLSGGVTRRLVNKISNDDSKMVKRFAGCP